MIFQTSLVVILVSLCVGQSGEEFGSCSCELSYKDMLHNPCIPTEDKNYCDGGYDCLCTFKFLQGCEATCGISPSEEDEGRYIFEDIEADSNCTCQFDWKKFWKGCQPEEDKCTEGFACTCANYHQGSFCDGSCSAQEGDETIVLIEEK